MTLNVFQTWGVMVGVKHHLLPPVCLVRSSKFPSCLHCARFRLAPHRRNMLQQPTLQCRWSWSGKLFDGEEKKKTLRNMAHTYHLPQLAMWKWGEYAFHHLATGGRSLLAVEGSRSHSHTPHATGSLAFDCRELFSWFRVVTHTHTHLRTQRLY